MTSATDAIEELTEAIRFTVEYVGTDTLPPIAGWSWFDALMKYAPEKAQAFTPPAVSVGEPHRCPEICSCGHHYDTHATFKCWGNAGKCACTRFDAPPAVSETEPREPLSTDLQCKLCDAVFASDAVHDCRPVPRVARSLDDLAVGQVVAWKEDDHEWEIWTLTSRGNRRSDDSPLVWAKSPGDDESGLFDDDSFDEGSQLVILSEPAEPEPPVVPLLPTEPGSVIEATQPTGRVDHWMRRKDIDEWINTFGHVTKAEALTNVRVLFDAGAARLDAAEDSEGAGHA